MKSVVFITGPWCNTCKAVKPIVADICKRKLVPMGVLDMVNDEEKIIPFSPTSLPTVVVMENDKESARFSGSFDIRSLEKLL